MQEIQQCPLCKSPESAHYLTCKDHTVSHETFELRQCHSCGFVFTSPRPELDQLPGYYHSEKYISHSDRASNAMDRVYKIARHFTLQWKLRVVNEHSVNKPRTLLDMGCGTGAFLALCQEKQLSITGVEPSQTAREQAIFHTHAPILSQLEEVQGQFDVITLWHVLEHIHNLHDTIEQLTQRLEKTGTMFIAVPNHKSHDAQLYRQHWAAYDVPRHLWHFSRKTMKRLLDQHNLKLVNVLPMRLDSYYVSLLSQRYMNGQSGLITTFKALSSAWQSNTQANKSSEYSSLIYIVRK